MIEVASVELGHFKDGATTIEIGSHTLMALRPTKCVCRLSLLVAIWSGKVPMSYSAGSTRNWRSCDVRAGTSTNAVDSIAPALLQNTCDSRSTVRLHEGFPEWPGT